NSKEQLNKFLICTKNMDILKNFNENYIIKYTYSKNPKTEEILKTWGSVGIKYLSFIKTMNFKLSQVNACVAISAAITAYSRIKMLKDIYLLQHYCNVYYIDTDSLVTDKPLPQILCGSELGKYKLEYDHCDGIFLTSKVYILKHKDSVQVLKIAFKGLTKDLVEKLTWEWFLSQYTNQTSVKFNLMNKMKKFFKFFEIYTNICMSYTTNFGMTKRIKVYNTQNQWINTKPFDNDLL
ncbi:MAG TPA: hypothetical protein VEX17_01105, partial [Bacillales bacterium]|nr:hypothetical protein [Bacillales bacterium]